MHLVNGQTVKEKLLFQQLKNHKNDLLLEFQSNPIPKAVDGSIDIYGPRNSNSSL